MNIKIKIDIKETDIINVISQIRKIPEIREIKFRYKGI
jgi:hypothetical protein